MQQEDLPFSEPVASTSRGVYTLSYRPPDDSDDEFEDFDQNAGYQLYSQAWTATSQRIQETLSTLHDASLDSIVRFVHPPPASLSSTPTLLSRLSSSKPLKTGLIIGVSPGSSSHFFTALCRQLVAPQSASDDDADEAPSECLVSRITSRDCGNVKNALKALMGGFMRNVVDAEDEEVEEVVEELSWTGDTASNPRLIALLEDLEATDPKVLAQLIDVLSQYSQTLPLTFLIGIGTSPNALHESLLRRSMNLLETERFFVEPGIGTFNALIRGVFIDWDAPLALGPKAYTYLLNSFVDMHHSIEATVSNIQYLYLHHFTTKPYAVLSLSPSDPSSFTLTSDLKSTLLDLDSIQDLQSQSSSDPLIQSLSSNSKSPDRTSLFLEEVTECRVARVRWQRLLKEGLVVVEAMQEAYEVPVESLDRVLKKVADGEARTKGKEKDLKAGLDKLLGMVRQSTSQKFSNLLTIVTSTLESLAQLEPSTPTDLLSKLSSVKDRLDPLMKGPKSNGRKNLVNVNTLGSEMLNPGAADREFTKLVSEVVDTLREGFFPTTDLTLHELWFCNDVEPLRQFHPSFQPEYTKKLQAADDVEVNEEQAPPDVAVAYRLYRETGKSINLGDWWTSFEQTAPDEPDAEEEEEEGKRTDGANGRAQRRKRAREEDEEEDEDEEGDEDEESEAEAEEDATRRKQARFLRAVGDLAYVGFLQPTSRKAEHVVKSVF
ncbi:origin recognition complex subunit 3 [Pseudohyphozyma bogoriensis]|nr:origin recognition complex subunit 3 [Pseudohyphozyma bogoriensis]